MAYSLIAHTAAQSANGAGVTSTAVNTTGANLIVLAAAFFASSGSETVSDSQSNTWTPLTVRHGNSGQNIQIYYTVSPSISATHTFTVSKASTFPGVAVSAWSGAATLSTFDVENGTAGSGASSSATGSITPSVDNELLIAVADLDSAGASVSSIDSSFTILDKIANGANGDGVAMAYLIETTATAQNPIWTFGGSCTFAVAIASFKAGAAAAGPVGNRFVVGQSINRASTI